MSVLGIDFGTSNSATAWVAPDGTLHSLALDGGNTAMPTALFFSAEDGHIAYGSAAMQAYLTAAKEQTGGRLMRSIKSLLGSRLMDEQTLINGQMTSFFDVVVLFFKELKRRSEACSGQVFECAMLGRPVHFVDDDPARDALAQNSLQRAALAAGFTQVGFELEPIAAAFDYERRLSQDTTVLVVDIGGGTSDFTVIQLGPSHQGAAQRAQDVLATTGTHIGGTDFDRLLNLGCVMPLMGKGHLGPTGREVPNSVFYDLSTWHLIHQAYSRTHLHRAQELWHGYADPRLHARLMHVLRERLGHQILHEVEAAKIACSVNQTEAAIALDSVEPGLQASISPEHMQQLLQTQLAAIVGCAQDCLSASGQAAPDVIYLTGGSSALAPLVAALQAQFTTAHRVQGDRFGGVAAGLAWAGFVGQAS